MSHSAKISSHYSSLMAVDSLAPPIIDLISSTVIFPSPFESNSLNAFRRFSSFKKTSYSKVAAINSIRL